VTPIQQDSHSTRDLRNSSLHPDSIIKTDDEGHGGEDAKIMIGDQSIDAHFLVGGDEEDGGHHPSDEMYDGSHYDDMGMSGGQGGNPFKDRTNAKSGSIIVSQNSLSLGAHSATGEDQNSG
jgi:hypothetical protein